MNNGGATAAKVFASRFDLVESANGALLLDVESGAFYRLNRAAAGLCAWLRETGDRGVTIERHASRARIPRAQAEREVDTVLALTEVERERPTRNAVRFDRRDGFVAMSFEGRAVLEIHHASQDLAIRSIATESDCDLAAALLWAAPHVIVLAGGAVLHASAVERGDRVFAFTGESGAGKTTLAHAFAGSGAALVSEDLVVIDGAGDTRVHVRREAERSIRAWVARRAVDLVEGQTVRGRELVDAIGGRSLPLAEVWFLDASRRTGSVIERRELEEIEGVSLLLANSFSEVGLPEVFRSSLSSSVAMARSARLSIVTVPDGIDRLAEALRQLQ